MHYDIQKFDDFGLDPIDNLIYFHKGLFDDTVWPGGPIAYVHLDGDWYDSTYNMLKRLTPHLSVGGYIVLDDAYSWSGARDAYIDFFNINAKWLTAGKTKNIECHRVIKVDDKDIHFRVFLSVRVGAKVVESSEGLDECQTKEGQ
jgi:Macrocin-O-methyltransferase (TylF)